MPANGESLEPTPYAIRCENNCNNGELIYLTSDEYDRQMKNPHDFWKCPRCRDCAWFNDENFEARLN